MHLGFAVDTPRGLVVPVIRHADRLSLRALAAESKRLATAVQDGTVLPDELTGGTFTVTNLGSLGVERFTPILNAPQVAILGVGSINLKPVMADEGRRGRVHPASGAVVDDQSPGGGRRAGCALPPGASAWAGGHRSAAGALTAVIPNLSSGGFLTAEAYKNKKCALWIAHLR